MSDRRADLPGQAGRLATFLLVGALALLLAACGNKGTVQKDEKKSMAALNAGLQAHAKNDLELASRQYHEALKYNQTNKYAIYDLALIDQAQGNYGLAEDKYRVVLGIDAKYEPALFNLAILRKARGDENEAVSLYKRAVTADPKDAAAQLNLGLLLRTIGNKKEGDTYVLRALALNPKLKDPSTTLSARPLKAPAPTSTTTP